jgi:hypothetical protein
MLASALPASVCSRRCRVAVFSPAFVVAFCAGFPAGLLGTFFDGLMSGLTCDSVAVASAMFAAVDLSIFCHAMTDHCALAVRAARRHRMDSAFEGVECPRHVPLGDGEALLIMASTYIAGGHFMILELPMGGGIIASASIDPDEDR